MADPATQLRIELINRARKWADSNRAPWYESLSTTTPVVMFEPYATDGGPRHGNFVDASYVAAISDAHWAARLHKAHPKRGALPPSRGANARELDSCTSSDALLLNVLCYPTASEAIAELLGIGGPPEFGVGGAVPKKSEPTVVADRSELDLVFRGERGAIALIVEAKLTERDFTRKPRTVVEQYASFHTVFDVSSLEENDEQFGDYQLIRNLLAAHYHQARFVLIHDARRTDLRARYNSVLQAVRQPGLVARSSALTWQDLAARCPCELQDFLGSKYGIAT